MQPSSGLLLLQGGRLLLPFLLRMVLADLAVYGQKKLVLENGSLLPLPLLSCRKLSCDGRRGMHQQAQQCGSFKSAAFAASTHQRINAANPVLCRGCS